MTSYVKEIVARLQGDDAEKIGAQNERKAKSAFKQQLSALETKEVDEEILVDEAIENYNNALYPTRKITDNKVYLENIKDAFEDLEDAKEALEATRESIKFFTEEQTKLFKSSK